MHFVWQWCSHLQIFSVSFSLLLSLFWDDLCFASWRQSTCLQDEHASVAAAVPLADLCLCAEKLHWRGLKWSELSMAVFSQWQQAPVFGSRQALPFFHYLSFSSAATSAANGDGQQAMPQQQQPRASMTLTMMLQSVRQYWATPSWVSKKWEREREKRRKRVTPSCRSLPSCSLLLLCFVVLSCVCLPFSTIADTHQLTSVCLSVSGSFLIRRHKICLLMLLQQLLLLMQCSGIQWWRRLRCNFTTMLQSSHVLLMFWGDQQCNDVPNLSVLVTRCHYHCTLHLGRWRHFAGVSLLFCLASLLEFFHIDPVMSLVPDEWGRKK